MSKPPPPKGNLDPTLTEALQRFANGVQQSQQEVGELERKTRALLREACKGKSPNPTRKPSDDETDGDSHSPKPRSLTKT